MVIMSRKDRLLVSQSSEISLFLLLGLVSYVLLANCRKKKLEMQKRVNGESEMQDTIRTRDLTRLCSVCSVDLEAGKCVACFRKGWDRMG